MTRPRLILGRLGLMVLRRVVRLVFLWIVILRLRLFVGMRLIGLLDRLRVLMIILLSFLVIGNLLFVLRLRRGVFVGYLLLFL